MERNDEKRKPPDFDWVTARHQCSSAFVFERLKREAQSNVDKRRSLLRNTRSEFRFIEEPYSFQVEREDFPASRRWVSFMLKGDTIEIRTSETTEPSVSTLRLNDDGECRLVLNGDELDRWQLLCRMLQGLFF